MTGDRRTRLLERVGGTLGLLVGLALVLPAAVAAHTINATYASRLPLAVYLVGAALTVTLSFAFVIVRDVRAASPNPRCRRNAATGLAADRAPGDRPHRLGLDHRAGDRGQ